MSYNFSGSRSARPSRPYRAYHAAPAKSGNRKQYINPSLFVRAARPVAETVYTPTHKFADFAVNSLLQANLAAKSINIPTPIQDQTISYALAGRDVVGIANTGTGKTIAFALPLLDKLIRNRQSRALIMAPTRELAQQIDAECRSLARGCGLYSAVLIGGSSMSLQLRDLRHRPQVVIGTPGRIKDHLERGSLELSGFNLVVLDEVDRMLDMGFINDMKTILAKLATPRQSFFFSATMSDSIKALVNNFVTDAVTISVKTGETSDNVDQNVVHYATNYEKLDKLQELLLSGDVRKALIFDETKYKVERLHKELVGRGFKAEAIHGGKSQSHRQRALSRFKASEVQLLVATDVAARGIDVVDITHVINYSTPQSYEDYAHRIGRTGRAGKIGHALTFVETR